MLKFGKLFVGLACRTWITPSTYSIARTISKQNDIHTQSQLENQLINDFIDKSAQTVDFESIMNSIPPDSGALSPGDTINIFSSLDKATGTVYKGLSFKLNQHPNFSILKEAAKASIPYCKVGEIIDVFKVVQKLNVPLDDELSIFLLSTLRSHTYDMSLSEIMLLDSFMRINGVHKTHLAEIVQRDLISRFNLRNSRMTIHFNDFAFMRRTLRFINLNLRYIDKEVLLNMSKNFEHQRIDISSADEAMKIIMELSRSPYTCQYFKVILQKAFDVWNASDISIKMTEKVFQVLTIQKSRIHFDSYNEKRFIKKCVQSAIQCGDIDKCFSILKSMNQLKFSNYQFIEFLSELIFDIDRSDLSLAIDKYVSYCKGCHLANYTPNENIKRFLAECPFNKYIYKRFNWMKIAIELHNIGVYHKPLIDAILENEIRFQFDFGSLAIVRELTPIPVPSSTEQVPSPTEIETKPEIFYDRLVADLKDIVGSHRLLVSLRVNEKFQIPFLIKVNKITKDLMSFNLKERTALPLIERRNITLIAIVSKPDSADDEHFKQLCNTILLKNIRLIILQSDLWLEYPLSKQVEELFAAISILLKNRTRIAYITETGE